MAQGNIKNVVINSTGWQAQIEIEGMGQSGSINTGAKNYFDTLFTSSTFNGLVISATSNGFDDNGNAITSSRTIYGTKFVRMPYPFQTLADQTITGSNVIVKCALSNYIYGNDTNVTATLSSSFYTSASIASTPTTSFICVNSSGLAHQKPIANWSYPSFTPASNSVNLRCVAFHNSAQQGRPVRAVKFTAKDVSGNSSSVIVNNVCIDRSLGDAIPVIEYTASIPTTNLTALQLITCSFVAYPWIGDNVLDTNDGVNAFPSPLYTNQYYLNDKNNTYGITIAVVDPYNGTDPVSTTYFVVDSASFNPGSPPSSYKSIGRAFTDIKVYNNASHSRNDCGGGIVLLKSGSYPWMGSTTSAGNLPYAWTTVKPFPGEIRDNVWISSLSGSPSYNNSKIKMENIKFTSTATSTINANNAALHWFNNCELSSSAGSTIIFTVGAWYVTNCMVNGFGTQGLSFTVGAPNYIPIVRGNNLSLFDRNIQCYTVIGNVQSGSQKTTTGIKPYNQTAPYGQWILAYNAFYNSNFVGNSLVLDNNTTYPANSGSAVIQNVIEKVSSNQADAILDIGSTTIASGSCTNCLYWYNTIVGGKNNRNYDETSSIDKLRILNFDANNFLDDDNFKNDWNLPGSENGSRVSNWSVGYSVGNSGNIYAETAQVGSAGSFLHDFLGFYGYQPQTTTPITLSLASFPQFINRASGITGVSGSGNGDYHISSSTSPLVNSSIPLLLPYDIEGTPRQSPGDAIGAFTFGYIPSSGPSSGSSVFNIVLRQPLGFNFPLSGATSGSLLGNIWYDIIRDALVSSGFVESSPVGYLDGTTGKWYLTGVKVVNAGLSKEFHILNNGNIEARAFIEE